MIELAGNLKIYLAVTLSLSKGGYLNKMMLRQAQHDRVEMIEY